MAIKRFRFRLEKVLTHRCTVRDEKKAILVRERQRLFDAEARLEGLIEAYNGNSVEQRGPGGITLEQMLLKNAYAERLKREIAEVRLQIVELEKSVKAALEEYLTANQEVRSLEILRDKRRQEYEELIQREEAKFLDELATQGSARGGGEL